MSYWSSEPDGCDYAFDAIGAVVFLIKERLEKETAAVKEMNYPEQSMIALLSCLRVIGEEYPKALSVSFRSKDYEKTRDAFYEWFESDAKIPVGRRDGIRKAAEREFQLFEERILGRQ